MNSAISTTYRVIRESRNYYAIYNATNDKFFNSSQKPVYKHTMWWDDEKMHMFRHKNNTNCIKSVGKELMTIISNSTNMANFANCYWVHVTVTYSETIVDHINRVKVSEDGADYE